MTPPADDDDTPVIPYEPAIQHFRADPRTASDVAIASMFGNFAFQLMCHPLIKNARGPQRTMMLQKLLESMDCAIRTANHKHEGT